MPPRHDSPPSIDLNAGGPTANVALTSRQAFLQVFPGVMVAMFLSAADQSCLASGGPTIASALAGCAESAWGVSSDLLAATIAAPL